MRAGTSRKRGWIKPERALARTPPAAPALAPRTAHRYGGCVLALPHLLPGEPYYTLVAVEPVGSVQQEQRRVCFLRRDRHDLWAADLHAGEDLPHEVALYGDESGADRMVAALEE